MSRVQVTATAEESRLAIWQSIATRSSAAADAQIREIDEQVRRYAENPMMAAAQPELGPGIRSFIVGKYVVIYRPIEDGIEVLLVIHGARDIPRHFRVAMRQLRSDIEPKPDEGRG